MNSAPVSKNEIAPCSPGEVRIPGRQNPGRTIAKPKLLAAALMVTSVAAALIGYWHNRLHQAEALLFKARVLIQTTAVDRRFQALESVQQAARIRPVPDLREEFLPLPNSGTWNDSVPPLPAVHRWPWMVASLVFSPDDRYLSCGAADGLIALETPAARQAWHVRGGFADVQAFAHDSGRLWAVSANTDRSSHTTIDQLPSRAGIADTEDSRDIQSVAFDASGRRVAAGKERGFVLKVFDTDSGTDLCTFTVTPPPRRRWNPGPCDPRCSGFMI